MDELHKFEAADDLSAGLAGSSPELELDQRRLEEATLDLPRIEGALLDCRTRLSAILQSTMDAVAITDVNGNVTLMNRVAEELTGWTASEARGRHVEEVFPMFREANPHSTPNPVERALNGDESIDLPSRTVLIAKDGAERLTAVRSVPMRGENGDICGAVLAIRDYTEQRRAILALIESEARNRAVLSASLDAIVAMDTTGRITAFNPAAERVFGYRASDAIGQSLAGLLIPQSLRESHVKGLQRYLQHGEAPLLSRRVETTALRADGSEIPVELAIIPTTVRGTLFFTGYVRDISDRRKAAEDLQASEARFQSLARSGIIGIIETDDSGAIHAANDAFLKIIGVSREEFASGALRWTDITPPEWRAYDDQAIEQLEANGEALPWQKEYLRKDGSRAPVLVGAARLNGSRNMAFVLDLTAEKRAEQARALALMDARNESAHRERAETALRETEDQLRQSQKMEAIGTLAGGVAHDFNNLLSIIIGYADMLIEGTSANDPLRADLEQISRAGKCGSDLTRQLLAFSRRQVLQPKTINLNATIASMVPMLRRLIGEHIQLDVLPTPDIGMVHVDPGQIEQVLLNLVVNSRDAMPHGGMLTIETANVEFDEAYSLHHLEVASGPYVMLGVTDTGVGMDRDTRGHIFEPFFTTKEKGKGTGLGLSTVYGIVKQSGGSIWVYSEPGKGTTFKMYLPRSNESAESSERSRLPAATLHGSETILLVEDDEHVRRMVLSLLRRHGYHVLDAVTPADALLICEQYRETIHLVLSDVVMPRLSGPQLWERLAALRPGMKVLFMSGYPHDATIRRSVPKSSVAFIQKPILPGSLLAKLRDVMDQDS